MLFLDKLSFIPHSQHHVYVFHQLMRNNGPHPTDAPESIQPPPDYIQVVACQTDAKCLTDQGTEINPDSQMAAGLLCFFNLIDL